MLLSIPRRTEPDAENSPRRITHQLHVVQHGTLRKPLIQGTKVRALLAANARCPSGFPLLSDKVYECKCLFGQLVLCP